MSGPVLLVTDDAGIQALVGQALTDAGLPIALAMSGPEALRRWKSDGPALIVMDVNVPGMDGVTVTERLRGLETRNARVPVILLGPADPELKVRGLRAGADDYLVDPVHPAELVVRARRLLARLAAAHPNESIAQGPTKGHVLAFYGAKGGVGTTTIAVNVAIALHRTRARRVVLVDANLQFGDHRVFLDIGVQRRSIIDAVAHPTIDADVLADVVVRHESGIDALLAPPSPEVADHVSAERHHVLQVVEVLRQHYDYVVVDLDQRLDDHALDVLGVADRVLVVLTADLSCIKNVRLVVETMGAVGVPNDRMALVMNRSNAMTGVSAKSVEAVLKRPIEHTVVNDYRAAITALNTGEPFMLLRSEAGIAGSILEMVRKIDSTVEATPAPRPGGLRALTGATAR
jgi:pilus assembly protein CpaE